jgi:hypothetical protein
VLLVVLALVKQEAVLQEIPHHPQISLAVVAVTVLVVIQQRLLLLQVVLVA